MRFFVLFVTLLISTSLHTGKYGCTHAMSDSTASTVSQTLPERPSADQLPNKEFLLSSAQSLQSLNEEGSVCPFVPIQHSNSRTHVSFKSPFLLLQNGKFIDIRICFLLTVNLSDAAGALSHVRYLYTIRKIRI